ncbi:cysteine proteinase ep-b 1-like protein, partial [Trifolium pratense]
MFSTVPQFADIDVETLQAEVDWRRSDTMTEIDNQCGCRTCWAYSVLSSIESVRKIKTERDYPQSHCGKIFIAGFESLPHVDATVVGEAESELKDAVTRQPIVASLFVGEEFESYKAGDGIFEKQVGKANDGLTSVDSGTVSEAAAVSGTVFSPSVVVPGFSKDA